MSLTTCSKEHCWGASLDNGWCNSHTNKHIVELEARIEELTSQDSDISHYAAMVLAENRKLEARIAELTAAAQALVDNVRRGVPIDLTAVENQLKLADQLAEVIK